MVTLVICLSGIMIGLALCFMTYFFCLMHFYVAAVITGFAGLYMITSPITFPLINRLVENKNKEKIKD